jgi:hypothetical protein
MEPFVRTIKKNLNTNQHLKIAVLLLCKVLNVLQNVNTGGHEASKLCLVLQSIIIGSTSISTVTTIYKPSIES